MPDISNYASVSNAMSSQLASRASTALQAASSATEDAKIEKAGRDFEALLLTSWLQQAEKSFATVPGADEDEDADCGKDQYMSLGMEALGTAMAASGGVGIAKMITSQLRRSEENEAAKTENSVS
jgi:Rod binding domain-containing protein